MNLLHVLITHLNINGSDFWLKYFIQHFIIFCKSLSIDRKNIFMWVDIVSFCLVLPISCNTGLLSMVFVSITSLVLCACMTEFAPMCDYVLNWFTILSYNFIIKKNLTCRFQFFCHKSHWKLVSTGLKWTVALFSDILNLLNRWHLSLLLIIVYVLVNFGHLLVYHELKQYRRNNIYFIRKRKKNTQWRKVIEKPKENLLRSIIRRLIQFSNEKIIIISSYCSMS